MSYISAHPTATSPPAAYEREMTDSDESMASDSRSIASNSTQRSGTPFSERASSVRLPDDNLDKTGSQLHDLHSLDLTGHDDSLINEMVDLTSSVFPDSALPFKVDDAFIDKCREHLTDKRYNWGTTENALATFLNTICAAIAAASGKPILRVWSASYCDTILKGSPIRRKPEVALLDHDFKGIPTWQDVRAVAEATDSKFEHSRIIRTVTDKAYIMLNTQPNRVFVPIISTWDKTKFRLTVTDRQGQLRTKTFNIEYGVRRADLLILLRILVGLCFGNNEAVGYDPTIIMRQDKVEAIMCAGMRFNVIRLIYATQTLIGQATHVWEVEHDGTSHILKDAWIERSRPMSEAMHLEKIGEMEGIPKLVCSEDVTINGVALSTGRLRHGVYGNSDMERIRRRTVTSSCGSHIAQFRSKRELISALKDIVVTLKTLATVKDLVHRDISYNNILLLDPKDGDSKENHRRGLLIDLEYAASMVTAQAMVPTGTAPFMAVELLLEGEGVMHRPSHDLESLFYVLVFICTNLEGPSTPRLLDDLLGFTSLPLTAWFTAGASLESLGTNKLGLAHAFERRVVGRFAPYFTDLKPCVMALFHAMYPNGPQIKSVLTHDGMIKIFTETLEKLPPHDVKFTTSQKSSNSRKRSLSIYDNCVLFAQSVKKLRRTKSPDQGSSLSQKLTRTGRHRRSTSLWSRHADRRETSEQLQQHCDQEDVENERVREWMQIQGKGASAP